jgi:hypothetical protein
MHTADIMACLCRSTSFVGFCKHLFVDIQNRDSVSTYYDTWLAKFYRGRLTKIISVMVEQELHAMPVIVINFTKKNLKKNMNLLLT